jgi:hypothetical protein
MRKTRLFRSHWQAELVGRDCGFADDVRGEGGGRELAPLLDDDRASLMKEPDWIREDIQEAWRRVERIQAVHLVVLYGMAAWAISRVLPSPHAF